MDLLKTNFKQFLAVIPANLLAICSGFHLAYGIYNTNIGQKIWMLNYSIPAISMIIISFHIMAFVGGVHACLWYRKMNIYKLHITSALPMICGVVTFFIFEDYFYAILSSRILIGFAFGTSHISSLFYISDISLPKFRAHFILFHHLCLTFGMFLHAVSHTFNALFGIAILCIALTCSTFPIGFYTMKDSHVFLIQNNKPKTLERMKYFQGSDVDFEHDAMQGYLIEEERRKFKFFGRHNILTLLIITMVQICYICVFNALHNYLRLIFMKSFFMEFTETLALTARIFGIFVSFVILDSIPKKIHFSIPALLISSILIAFGAVIIFYIEIWIPVPFFITIEFLLGLGMGGMSEILKSELFPMKERWLSMAVACFVEEGLQIVAIIVLYSWMMGLGSTPTYWSFVFGGLLLICGGFVLYVLKDSRKQHVYESSMMYNE